MAVLDVCTKYFRNSMIKPYIKQLEKQWYNIRISDKNWNIEETIWNNKFEKNNEKLLELKKQLIKFI